MPYDLQSRFVGLRVRVSCSDCEASISTTDIEGKSWSRMLNKPGHEAIPVASVPAFSPMVDDAAGMLRNMPSPQIISPATTLLHHGELPRSVGLIRSGIVKMTYLDADGHINYLGLRSEGWWLNATLALLNLPSLCDVSTLTLSSISFMSAADFSIRLQRDPQLLRQFLTTQCRELLMVQQHSIMHGASANERLEYLRGESSHSIWRTVDPTLVMRQSEIAELLGISPEHFSRMKKKHRSDPPSK